MWDHTQTSLHSIFDWYDWKIFNDFCRTLHKLDLSEEKKSLSGVGPGVCS